jgi:hypothetical protein
MADSTFESVELGDETRSGGGKWENVSEKSWPENCESEIINPGEMGELNW